MQTPAHSQNTQISGSPKPVPNVGGKVLIVSLHDVSPLTRAASHKILADLSREGVREVSLLVIPDHHHKAPIQGDTGFRDWLREASEGREVVAHGFFHRRAAPKGESRTTRLITAHYTAGEGEFFDLTEEEARLRLAKGLDALAWCGFSPTGFIAPAWLLGEDALRAVKAAGFQYTTRLHCIETFHAAPVRSQSLVWSVRSAWRRQCSLLWNPALAMALRRNPVLRVGIHPPDWEFPAIRDQILHQIRAALAHRAPMTYQSWVDTTQS